MGTNGPKRGYTLRGTRHNKNDRLLKANTSKGIDQIERTKSYTSKKAVQIAMAHMRKNGWFVHLYIPHSHTIKSVKDVTQF